jgi:hypothetical protein
MTEGNLRCFDSGADWTHANGTMIIPKDKKIYFEIHAIGQTKIYAGVALADENSGAYSAGSRPDGGWIKGLISLYTDSSGSNNLTAGFRTQTDGTALSNINTSDGAGFTNVIVGVAIDQANGKVDFYKNGSTNSDLIQSITSTACFNATSDYVPIFAGYSGAPQIVNFGQDSSFGGLKTAQGNQDGNDIGDFYYTPPTGYFALCTSNLPDVDIVPSEHFNTITYTGDGNNTTITGVGFQSDLVWFKARNNAWDNALFDSVRGGSKRLRSNQTSAEDTTTSGYVSSFNSDGYAVVHGGSNHKNLNQNTWTYVAWNWKANGSGSSNTNGTITSTVSANVDSGFSIVSYTGTGANATVGHGLSLAPEMMFIKGRENTHPFNVYHKDLGTTYWLYTNSTLAVGASGTNRWNSTAPDSTKFSLGWSANVNESTKGMIAYCFHSVDGYSKVGSYTGNGNADGTFVYTGFRPAYVMIKPSSRTGNWMVANNKSSPSNVVDKVIFANDSAGEYTDPSADCKKDFFSNGFKIRTTDDNTNESGETYIYIAFAETPFKYSNAR